MKSKILNQKICIVFACLIFLYSCKSDRQVDYYPDGKIKSSSSIVGGIKNGFSVNYYNNGVIKCLCRYQNDTLEGMAMNYDSLGNLSYTQTLKKGKSNGFFQTYYNNKSIKKRYFIENDKKKGEYLFFDSIGKIKEKREYIIHNGESELNQYIVYNQTGKIEKENSNYFTVYSEKDTINFGEKYKLKIQLNAPIFENMQVIVGAFNEEFNIFDGNPLDTVHGNNSLVAIVNLDAKKKGLNKYSGAIDNYGLTNANDSTANMYKSRYLFFSKSVFVK